LEIISKQFGKIEIDENRVITMPKGLPGFKGLNRFALIEHENLDPFISYQSIDDPGLAFILVNPFRFYPNYDFDVEKTFEEMSWSKEDLDKIYVYVIINASGNNPKDVTANLIGPLILNTIKNEVVQVILNTPQYSSKHPLVADE